MKSVPIILFCFSVVLVSCNLSGKEEKQPGFSLVPKPNQISLLKGVYKTNQVFVISSKTGAVPADQIISLFREHLNGKFQIEIQENSVKESNSDFSLIFQKEIPSESYKLLIDKSGIKLEASDYNGFFYGIQTLMQLIDEAPKTSSGFELPGLQIVDGPAFKWRGMHLDVCRHFFGVPFIKKMLDGMAMHKLNTFHWHLTDDQGWRIGIKKYPLLVTKAAWRDETIIGHMAEFPSKFDGQLYGGYYTQDEIKEVVSYAAKLGITVVPEIEMPGHAVAALTAYPQFSCTGGPIKPFNEWGVSDNVYCAGKESTFQFMEDVLTEVVELFPGDYIHIGGDECPKTRWEKCPDCQLRMKKEGLKNETELQSYFVQRIEKFLNSKGKKIIGWDEILEGGLAENAAVMSWRGEEGGVEAANLGHAVVMTPNATCYLDKYQSEDYEPLTIGGLLTMSDIYNWQIIPKELAEEKQHLILGAQGNVWTEYMPDEKQVEYMVFPRLCAMSEILWTKKENLNFEDFTHRMAFHYNRLDAKNIRYRVPYPQGIEKYNPIIDQGEGVVLKNEIPTSTIHFTIDGTEPNEKSPIYIKPIKLNLTKPVEMKAVTIMSSGRKSAVVSGIFEKVEYRKGEVPGDLENGIQFKRYEKPFTSASNVGGTPDSTGILDKLEIPSGKSEQFFGVEFSGFIEVPYNGIYTFYLDCDDGAILSIDSQLVVDNDGYKYGGSKQGKIALAGGKHPFVIKYFQGKYGYYIDLKYQLNYETVLPVEPNQYFTLKSN